MAQDEQTAGEPGADGLTVAPDTVGARRLWRLAGILALTVLLAALAIVWFSRTRIADELITRQLTQLDLPATYEIESIAAGRQVLRNVVIGDPRRPDLTIARVELALLLNWGSPTIGRVSLERPRLYGSYRAGKLSFGSLDKVLFTGRKQPPGLPDFDVAIVDGRARLDSDFGPVGLKIDGQGNLRGGFSGVVAAIVRPVDVSGCRTDSISAYGAVSVTAQEPRFAGPVRLGALACPGQAAKLAGAGLQVDAVIDANLGGAEGTLGFDSGALVAGGIAADASSGKARFLYRKQALTLHYDVSGQGIAAPQAGFATLRSAGVLRAANGLARVELEGNIVGGGLRTGPGMDNALAGLQRAGAGTLAAPVVAQIRMALRREASGSRMAGQFVLHRKDGAFSFVMPQGSVTGSSGAALLAVSRVQWSGAGAVPLTAGNFTTGGVGLPRIVGRLERGAGGGMVMRLAMAEYRAATARIAVPQLMLAQSVGGAAGFAGTVLLTGDLPGGRAEGLVLPVDGNWSNRGGLAIWRKCTLLMFDSLSVANLRLARQRLTLCPPPGGAILRSGPAGVRVAAGAPALTVSGRLGQTPIRINSGPVGFAWPGTLAARSLDILLGPEATGSRFRIANLTAKTGSEVAGRFDGSDVLLASVPLDIRDAAGDWRFAKGKLSLTNAGFRLEDRDLDDRFQPLIAQGAALQLADNHITAEALLREPASGRAIVRTVIRHDLAKASGHADLVVDGIVFDKNLQPDTLSHFALGVIANAAGALRGGGQVDWNGDRVTSSGSFTTDGLDFAAAFGPVKKASGTINFTDLIGMVTAPDQRLKIAAINPGIEVNDGELSYALLSNRQLAVNGAQWPFLGGTLTLEPTRMTLGGAEVRRFILTIVGLDAARLVEQMEMNNLSASGTFDGRLPLLFDEQGGRIVAGKLASRPPGGNVSYVGALSYKDLSAMGNFAFEALKSVDYRQMQIEMNGALSGEIITQVGFDGISQGAGAKRNFLTRRIAKLPIRFIVNLRAPFFSIVNSFRSLYDPAMVRDPRELGLVGSDGRVKPVPKIYVQPPVSEKAP